MTVASPTTPAKAPPRALLPLSCLAIVPVLMNYTTPLVSPSETAAGVGAGPMATTWLMNATPLGLAAALLVAGTLADNLGRRRLLVLGSATMAVTSGIAALATTPGLLIGARIGQGAAGAAIIAASLGLLGNAYTDPADRGRATGWWATALGAGLAVGPLATGALTAVGSWRTVYWCYVAAGILLSSLLWLIPESRSGSRKPIHYTGIATFVAGMTFLLAALTLARTGWTGPGVLALLAATVAALAGFALSSLRHRAPLVEVRLFRHRPFVLSVTGSGLNGLLMIGVISVLPVAWQHEHSLSALELAIPFTAYPVASLITARLSRYVPLASARMLALGYTLSLGQLLLLGTVADWSMPQVMLAYLVAGVGSGFANSANARMAVDSVPAEHASMGSGAANTARYVGSAVGVAIGVAVLGGTGRTDGADLLLSASAVLLGIAALAYLTVSRARPGLA